MKYEYQKTSNNLKQVLWSTISQKLLWRHLRYGGIFDYWLITKYSRVHVVKINKSSNIWPSCNELLRLKNSPAIWRMAVSHCCNSSKLRQHIDLDFGDNKYQTCVAKSSTDTITEWLKVICVQLQRHVCCDVFFTASAARPWQLRWVFVF